MKLTSKQLENKKVWENAGFELPAFDRNQMIQKTKSKMLKSEHLFYMYLYLDVKYLLKEGEIYA